MKKPRVGQCIYCLREPVQVTKDHVFPWSWYPSTTPSNLDKWKVPACRECNNKFGAVENELLIRLGLCVDPKEVKSLGISETALRSIKPECAETPGEREIRLKKRQQIQREIKEMEGRGPGGIFPNFGPKDGPIQPDAMRVPISKVHLEIFGTKLTRGLTYAFEKKVIQASHAIRIYFPWEDAVIADLFARVKAGGTTSSRGPG